MQMTRKDKDSLRSANTLGKKWQETHVKNHNVEKRNTGTKVKYSISSRPKSVKEQLYNGSANFSSERQKLKTEQKPRERRVVATLQRKDDGNKEDKPKHQSQGKTKSQVEEIEAGETVGKEPAITSVKSKERRVSTDDVKTNQHMRGQIIQNTTKHTMQYLSKGHGDWIVNQELIVAPVHLPQDTSEKMDLLGTNRRNSFKTREENGTQMKCASAEEETNSDEQEKCLRNETFPGEDELYRANDAIQNSFPLNDADKLKVKHGVDFRQQKIKKLSEGKEDTATNKPDTKLQEYQRQSYLQKTTKQAITIQDNVSRKKAEKIDVKKGLLGAFSRLQETPPESNTAKVVRETLSASQQEPGKWISVSVPTQKGVGEEKAETHEEEVETSLKQLKDQSFGKTCSEESLGKRLMKASLNKKPQKTEKEKSLKWSFSPIVTPTMVNTNTERKISPTRSHQESEVTEHLQQCASDTFATELAEKDVAEDVPCDSSDRCVEASSQSHHENATQQFQVSSRQQESAKEETEKETAIKHNSLDWDLEEGEGEDEDTSSAEIQDPALKSILVSSRQSCKERVKVTFNEEVHISTSEDSCCELDASTRVSDDSIVDTKNQGPSQHTLGYPKTLHASAANSSIGLNQAFADMDPQELYSALAVVPAGKPFSHRIAEIHSAVEPDNHTSQQNNFRPISHGRSEEVIIPSYKPIFPAVQENPATQSKSKNSSQQNPAGRKTSKSTSQQNPAGRSASRSISQQTPTARSRSKTTSQQNPGGRSASKSTSARSTTCLPNTENPGLFRKTLTAVSERNTQNTQSVTQSFPQAAARTVRQNSIKVMEAVVDSVVQIYQDSQEIDKTVIEYKKKIQRYLNNNLINNVLTKRKPVGERKPPAKEKNRKQDSDEKNKQQKGGNKRRQVEVGVQTSCHAVSRLVDGMGSTKESLVRLIDQLSDMLPTDSHDPVKQTDAQDMLPTDSHDPVKQTDAQDMLPTDSHDPVKQTDAQDVLPTDSHDPVKQTGAQDVLPTDSHDPVKQTGAQDVLPTDSHDPVKQTDIVPFELYTDILALVDSESAMVPNLSQGNIVRRPQKEPSFSQDWVQPIKHKGWVTPMVQINMVNHTPRMDQSEFISGATSNLPATDQYETDPKLVQETNQFASTKPENQRNTKTADSQQIRDKKNLQTKKNNQSQDIENTNSPRESRISRTESNTLKTIHRKEKNLQNKNISYTMWVGGKPEQGRDAMHTKHSRHNPNRGKEESVMSAIKVLSQLKEKSRRHQIHADEYQETFQLLDRVLTSLDTDSRTLSKSDSSCTILDLSTLSNFLEAMSSDLENQVMRKSRGKILRTELYNGTASSDLEADLIDAYNTFRVYMIKISHLLNKLNVKGAQEQDKGNHFTRVRQPEDTWSLANKNRRHDNLEGISDKLKKLEESIKRLRSNHPGNSRQNRKTGDTSKGRTEDMRERVQNLQTLNEKIKKQKLLMEEMTRRKNTKTWSTTGESMSSAGNSFTHVLKNLEEEYNERQLGL